MSRGLGDVYKRQSDNSNQMESSSDTPFPEDDSGEGLTDDDIPF